MTTIDDVLKQHAPRFDDYKFIVGCCGCDESYDTETQHRAHLSELVRAAFVVELTERMDRAVTNLNELRSDEFRSESDRTRLAGKAEGVSLALSYLREMVV